MAAMADSLEGESPRATSESSLELRTERTWREWSKRENGEAGYKFGDFSRGVLNQMKEGVRDMKHRIADTALNLKESHEQRAVDYALEVAATDEELQDVALNAANPKASTSAERLWTKICKDAHSDHDPSMDEAEGEDGPIGMLEVEVLKLGSDDQALLRTYDRKPAEKAVLLLSLTEKSRSKALKEEKSAKFQVNDLVGADLLICVFDRASSHFDTGFEDKAFCGGCVLPLSAIVQPHHASLTSALYSSFSKTRFESCLRLQLLPLPLVRGRRKLQSGELSGVKKPQDPLGQIVLKLKLNLKQCPAMLLLEPSVPEVPAVTESKGHVSDPFSIIKACGMAVARLQLALKMELWKAALESMRQSFFTWLWWTTLMWAPLWTWPFLFNVFLCVFAWQLNSCHRSRCDRRLYSDEGGDETDEKKDADVVKEAVKFSLHIMQFTENLNKAAAQIEKLTFALVLEDRCLSSICLMLALTFAVPMCFGNILLQWIFSTVYWRLLVWFPGSFVVLPEGIREVLFDILQQVMEIQQQLMGDDFERRLQAFWHRVPDETEASHLYLCKRYIVREQVG